MSKFIVELKNANNNNSENILDYTNLKSLNDFKIKLENFLERGFGENRKNDTRKNAMTIISTCSLSKKQL